MMPFISLEQQNNGFGPISRKRGQHSYYAALAFVGLALTFSILSHGDPFKKSLSANIGTFLGAISSLICGELIRRVLFYAEEQYHLDERYLGSKKEALSKCISFSSNNGLIFNLWICSAVGWYWLEDHHFSGREYLLVMLALQLSHFTMDYWGVKMSDVEISTLSETQIKNVAVGLAWSYYFGYLKLILPGWDSNFQRAVHPDFSVDGEDACKKLTSKKLFIVMPKNCYCYDKLEKADQRISSMMPMPTQLITRGGIQERSYRNMLYRVQLDGSSLYLMIEYATPLLSIYDMAKNTLSGFSQADLNTQVVEFYKTLKMILDADPDCRGKYELVLVADPHHNLAEILKDKITETKLNTP